MRMFRLSSWITESRGCDKVVSGDEGNKMATAIRSPTDSSVAIAWSSKRKRESSEDTFEVNREEPDAKRRKADDSQESLSNGTTKEQGQLMGEPELGRRRARETIETQFGLEILLKHDELRLINQEVAKCQMALEQLRRCHLVPYPTSQGTPESMVNVMNGTGPAVAPKWAPPYGIMDGPYTRHYAGFLKPDPRFDGVPVEWYRGSEASHAGPAVPEGRSTRNSIADGSTPVTKSRSQRGSTSHKLQALSNGYPQPKGKNGPSILKRSDGQTVKLVCIDCHREDFSSVQGFINHCRIAHHRDFKSHEEAAVACGEVIEVDEVGGLGGEKNTAATGLVHPLIRSAPTDREAYTALLSRIDASMDLYRQGKLPGVTSIPTSKDSNAQTNGIPPHPNFVPSKDTPHLSTLLKNKGFAGNLGELVSEAKMPVNFDELSSHDEEFDDEETPVDETRERVTFDGPESSIATMRMPARAVPTTSVSRPSSSKGIENAARKPSGMSPRPSHAIPIVNTAAAANHYKPPSRLINNHNNFSNGHNGDHDLEMPDVTNVDLSPNTVASNNAPSLVSDDGEYDEGDDAETTSSEAAEDDSDVAEIDIEDGDLEKVVPRTVVRTRGGSSGEGNMRIRKEDKHVTFVSPIKDNKKQRKNRT